MSALYEIQSEGFNLSIEKMGGLGVIPSSKLTDLHREFITSHKAEILAELKAANDSESKFKRFRVSCDGRSNNVISPNGITLETMRNKFAKSEVEVLH